MLDKKKLIGIVVAGVIIVAGLTVMIILGLSGQGSKEPAAQQGRASSPASPAAAAPVALELSSEEKQTLITAAVAAAKFDNNPDHALKPADYVQAGFTETLSKTYKPIWAGLFAGRSDQKGAQIGARSTSPGA